MLRIINSNLGTFYIEKVEPYTNPTLVYNVVVAKLLDEDKKEICELYEGDNLVELAEQISVIENIDKLVDILRLDNAMWSDSTLGLKEQWLNEYKENLDYWEYEEEHQRLLETEIEWFENCLEDTICRVGQTYFIINF